MDCRGGCPHPDVKRVYPVSRSRDKIDLFGVDTSTRVPRTASYNQSTGWSTWRDVVPNSSVRASGSPAVYATVRRSDHIDIFVVGSDRKVYTAAWNPSFGSSWGGWWEVGKKGQAGTLRTYNYSIDLDEVTGWVKLQIWSGGAYVFSGHFHGSGFWSYDVSTAIGLKDRANNAITFAKRGHVNGTLESGSRDYDWFLAGTDQRITDHFTNGLAAINWGSRATNDLGPLLDAVIIGLAGVVRVGAIVGG
jgi:hypothetical protein